MEEKIELLEGFRKYLDGRLKRYKDTSESISYPHTINMLAYGIEQEGRVKECEEILDSLEEYIRIWSEE